MDDLNDKSWNIATYNHAYLESLKLGRHCPETESISEALDRHLSGIRYAADDIH